ncbi:hypothetical protein PR048_027475 [Dryococelus australis]|uniref:Uncharacterized protein n=1 Tax=Dryococelus australis TaxID=614101 RepID=A0ABQ9GGN4_9NEOP|nr:hypothetical protein PR048_027475 [Dryococelus australis]
MVATKSNRGAIPGRVAGFLQVGIVPGRCRWSRVFSGISRPPTPKFRRSSTFTLITLIGSQCLVEMREFPEGTRTPTESSMHSSHMQHSDSDPARDRTRDDLVVGERSSTPGMEGGGNGRSPRKFADMRHRPGTIPTCEIPWNDPARNLTRIAVVGGGRSSHLTTMDPLFSGFFRFPILHSRDAGRGGTATTKADLGPCSLTRAHLTTVNVIAFIMKSATAMVILREYGPWFDSGFSHLRIVPDAASNGFLEEGRGEKDLPPPPAVLHSSAATDSPRLTFIGSQDPGTLDVSDPMADLRGNTYRVPYCQGWSNTGYSLEPQPMDTQLRLEFYAGLRSLAYRRVVHRPPLMIRFPHFEDRTVVSLMCSKSHMCSRRADDGVRQLFRGRPYTEVRLGQLPSLSRAGPIRESPGERLPT